MAGLDGQPWRAVERAGKFRAHEGSARAKRHWRPSFPPPAIKDGGGLKQPHHLPLPSTFSGAMPRTDHVGQALPRRRGRAERGGGARDSRWVADDEALRVAAAKKAGDAEMAEAAAEGWHETADGWYEAAEEGATASEEPVQEEDLALANINAAIEERLADLTRVTKEHEATGGPAAGRPPRPEERAARYASSPSPHPDALARAAREDANSAERGRQERMRRRQENHEARSRPRPEARTAWSAPGRRSVREADDSAARRSACAEVRGRKEEDEGLRPPPPPPPRPRPPPPCHPARKLEWNPHAYSRRVE
ncbi:hypothetical protein QYE76_068315 [Lolium multiflorum]|uniref:Uncharacterized protein n=1 Tax=Lolium multiflorum TaxID=4521 RepID=A0AAD8WCI3_LOLMU|nr:hypothetical protein QYE76_068315 [Lolium multiflorum]